MTANQYGFHAMPDCPHLTHTWCGYMLLTLAGLDPDLTTDQIDKITLNGVNKEWKPMGDQTVMIIPSFRQEAQRLVIHTKSCSGMEEEKSSIWPLPKLPQPDLSMGLGKATNRYHQRGI